jgi:hypothetical protein
MRSRGGMVGVEISVGILRQALAYKPQQHPPLAQNPFMAIKYGVVIKGNFS